MTDWRKKIDDMVNAQNAEQQKREAIEKLAQEELERETNEKEKANYNAWCEEFKCHVCGNWPSGPLVTQESYNELEYLKDVTHWNTPANHKRCGKCRKWTCNSDDCIRKGICKNCAEKM